VAVEMDRVGHGGCSGVLLDDPVLPLFCKVSYRSRLIRRVKGGVVMHVHVHVIRGGSGVAYFVLLADFEDMAAGSECVVAIDDVLERRVLEIHEHGYAIDEPLNKIATSRGVGEPDFQILGHVLWYACFDVGHHLFVIAPCGQRCCSCGVGLTRPGTSISEDTSDVSGVGVRSIASSTSAYAKPVVADRRVGMDDDIVSLTCKRGGSV
jgi:hypothetical protein